MIWSDNNVMKNAETSSNGCHARFCYAILFCLCMKLNRYLLCLCITCYFDVLLGFKYLIEPCI